MAINVAIAGDVDVKLMYALIEQRNLGKGMAMPTRAGEKNGNIGAEQRRKTQHAPRRDILHNAVRTTLGIGRVSVPEPYVI